MVALSCKINENRCNFNRFLRLIDMKTPFFSIIIPVYNAGRFLGECLHSIANQDFTDWEVIIVDDGSTDNSVEVAGLFMRDDHRVKLFRMPFNSGGAYMPRMKGARMASGSYLVTIDADDTVSADLLSSHHKIIASSNVDMVIPEMWRSEEDSCVKLLPIESFDSEIIWKGSELVSHTLCGWKIPMAGFAVRRGIYLESDMSLSLHEKGSIFADELLSRWLLFHCGKVAFCDARYYYRYNDVSVTHANPYRFICDKMLTCDSITAMAASSFGESSPTYLLSLDNKFLSAVDCLRVVNGSHLAPDESKSALQFVDNAIRGIDFNLLKGRISPRYLALMSLPLPLARHALRVIDRLLKK